MTSPSLAGLRDRLAQVNPALVPPEAIQTAKAQGASLIDSDPSLFLRTLCDRARAHPVLAAASGLGAVQAAEQTGGPDRSAYARLGLAIALTWWGYFHEALAHLNRVQPIFEAERSARPLPYVRWYVTLAHRRFGKAPNASEQLLTIADEIDDAGDPVNAMRCRQDSISEVSVTTHYDQAIEILQTAQDFFAARSLHGDLGLSQILQVSACFRRGLLPEGVRILGQADENLQRAEWPATIGFAWYMRGIYHVQQRQVAGSLHWLRMACQRSADLRHDYYQTLSLLQIAAIQWQQGDLQAALQTREQIDRLASELELVFLTGVNTLEASNIYFRQGAYERAAEGYRRAHRILAPAGYVVEPAVCTMNLGIVARRKGNFAEGLRLINEARVAFEETHSYENLANAHHNLGKTYAAFGYLEPALEHLQICLDELARVDVPAQAARPAMYMARILAEKGDFEQARQRLEQAANEAQTAGLDFDAAVCERIRGDVLLRQGQESDALRAYKRSLSHFRQMEQTEAAWEAQLGIAEAHLARVDTVAAALELEQIRPHPLPAGLRWRCHVLEARVARQRNRPTQALDAYLQALDHVRSARRSLEREEQAEQFMLMLQSVYDDAFALALQLDDAFSAMHIAELRSAQLLDVRLGHSDTHTLPIDRLLHTVATHLTERLGKEWTALRYAWQESDLWLFILTPDGLQYQALPLDPASRLALRTCASPDDSFRRFVYLGESAIQSNAADVGRDSRRRLGRSLLPPSLLDRFDPDHTLIIIPSRELYGLPFHALLVEDRPLIEHTCVAYSQSLSTLAALYDRHPLRSHAPERGLILAQAEFEDRDNLPHVTAEAEAIRNWAHPNVDCFRSTDLSRNTLVELNRTGRLGDYGWLHIATHTQPDMATGYFTGLRLGDGVVDLEEIRQWRLAARLVTLSACQTGQGRWYYGDEIAGLVQAFLSAGAQTIVASSWLAADEFTARLMTMFYEALSAAPGPVAALASAQRAGVRMGIEPYYWAPFNVFGLP